MNNGNEILNGEFESEIKEDEKIVEELNKKIEEYELQIANYEKKKMELDNTLRDLDSKNEIDGISDETKAKIAEVQNTVTEKINEINSQTEELNNKIKETKELITPKSEPEPAPETAPESEPEPVNENIENKESPAVSDKNNKIQKLENKIRDFENKRSEKETYRSSVETKRSEKETEMNSPQNNDFNAQIDEQIRILQEQQNRLEEVGGNIDEKMDDENVNEATRERLEEMRDEVQDKIDEIQDKIDELEEKKDEHNDIINDEIDELNDKIDEINDEIDEINDEIEEIYEEIDEIKNGTVDEDVINEVNNSIGFDNINNLINNIMNNVNSALANVGKNINISIPKIPEINIPVVNIKIPEKSYSSDNSDNRNKKYEGQYNVNFCSTKAGAKISSVCCEHSGAERAVNLLDDDPNFNEKWCATNGHGTVKIVRPHWVIVDFGEMKTFNYLKLVKCSPGHGHRDDTGNKNYDASAWRFEVSSDKENWVEFNRETDDKSGIYEKKFGTLTGRYVRLFVDAGGSDPNNKYHGVRLYDLRIEMRDENGDSKNLCKDARIESCCYQGRGGRDDSVNHLIDDDPKYNTKWYVEGAHEEKTSQPHWVIIDMGETRTFNHIRIVKASEGKHDYGDRDKNMSAWRVEVSSDRTTWKEFNKETNDRSSIYEKTFTPQTGRYIRLWVDAAESDPNNRNGHVRIYDLRLEMVDKKENSGQVTFDDIIAIAPFAKKDTLDKLVEKLVETDDFNKIKALAPFLSKDTLNNLIARVSGKADSNTIRALAPFLSRETLDRLVEELDEDMDFDKIKALAPFLSKKALARCVTRGGVEIDMKRLRSLAPFLGSDVIDEIISKMM